MSHSRIAYESGTTQFDAPEKPSVWNKAYIGPLLQPCAWNDQLLDEKTKSVHLLLDAEAKHRPLRLLDAVFRKNDIPSDVPEISYDPEIVAPLLTKTVSKHCARTKWTHVLINTYASPQHTTGKTCWSPHEIVWLWLSSTSRNFFVTFMSDRLESELISKITELQREAKEHQYASR